MVKNKIVGGGHVSEMPWHLRSATKIINFVNEVYYFRSLSSIREVALFGPLDSLKGCFSFSKTTCRLNIQGLNPFHAKVPSMQVIDKLKNLCRSTPVQPHKSRRSLEDPILGCLLGFAILSRQGTCLGPKKTALLHLEDCGLSHGSVGFNIFISFEFNGKCLLYKRLDMKSYVLAHFASCTPPRIKPLRQLHEKDRPLRHLCNRST